MADHSEEKKRYDGEWGFTHDITDQNDSQNDKSGWLDGSGWHALSGRQPQNEMEGPGGSMRDRADQEP